MLTRQNLVIAPCKKRPSSSSFENDIIKRHCPHLSFASRKENFKLNKMNKHVGFVAATLVSMLNYLCIRPMVNKALTHS